MLNSSVSDNSFKLLQMPPLKAHCWVASLLGLEQLCQRPQEMWMQHLVLVRQVKTGTWWWGVSGDWHGDWLLGGGKDLVSVGTERPALGVGGVAEIRCLTEKETSICYWGDSGPVRVLILGLWRLGCHKIWWGSAESRAQEQRQIMYMPSRCPSLILCR